MDNPVYPPPPQFSNEPSDLNPPLSRSMTVSEIFFSFRGRMGRGTWWFTQISILIYVLVVGMTAAGISEIALDDFTTKVLLALGIVPVIVFIWISLATSIKRWHDLNKSGWWELIRLIPVVGGWWHLIELGFSPGSEGVNEYGVAADQLP